MNAAGVNERCPPGISLLRRIRESDWNMEGYRKLVFVLTFLAYATYEAAKQPKTILNSMFDPAAGNTTDFRPWPWGSMYIEEEDVLMDTWAPFSDDDGAVKLLQLDLVFLSSYTVGTYIAGDWADNADLRKFLGGGMIFTGISCGMFGMGYFWDIHNFQFYFITQIFAGLFQATGWPSVVSIMATRFAQKRGLIMGIWNVHESVGNIVGLLVAASLLHYGWGWCFIIPAGLIWIVGILVYLLLTPPPNDIRFETHESRFQQTHGRRRGIGLVEACKIRGIIPYALCLFFTELVAHTFVSWLPNYLTHKDIGGQQMSVKTAINLSTLFVVGSVIGGIVVGYISDKFRSRARTVVIFVVLSIIFLLLYSKFGHSSKFTNVALMMMAALFLSGPLTVITTAVSADLGARNLRENEQALATVTAIIDGTGCIGGAIGPLLTNFLYEKWDEILPLLIGCCLTAILLSCYLVVAEMRETQLAGERDNISVRAEHALFPNKPIHLIADTFGGCLALSVAALDPTSDLVQVLLNQVVES